MKILILDDHALFRDGLQYLFKAVEPSIELLQAGNLQQAQTILEQNADVAMTLIDLNMPGHDGFEALDLFTSLFPTMPCVILSSSNKRSDVERAIDNGAMGFISKHTEGPSLQNALKLILAGEIYVPHNIMYSERRVERANAIHFTVRQLEVMSLVRQGDLNKVIADKLNVAESTIKKHLSCIFEKLNVHNRTAAIEQINKLKINLPNIQ